MAVEDERIHLPLLTPSDFEGKLPQFVELAEAGQGMTWEDMQTWLNQTVPWTAEIVGEGDDRRAVMELQAIRLGDTAVVSVAGEIFAQTGLSLKKRSPVMNTMFAAYTNGLVCYIPPEEEYHRGGYEVNEVYVAYRLPSPPAPEAAKLVEDTAVQLLIDISA